MDHVIDIVDGLREWFTSNADAGIASDALRFSSFVIEERECCCEILWLAVERDYHGRGYGTLLLRKTKEYACGRGKHDLTVKTYGGGDYEPYVRTLNFYKSKGFKVLEAIDQYKSFGGQLATILMKLLKRRRNPRSGQLKNSKIGMRQGSRDY